MSQNCKLQTPSLFLETGLPLIYIWRHFSLGGTQNNPSQLFIQKGFSPHPLFYRGHKIYAAQ